MAFFGQLSTYTPPLLPERPAVHRGGTRSPGQERCPARGRLLRCTTSLTAPRAKVHTQRVPAETTPGPSVPDRQRAALNALAVQLMRESPRLVRALANAQVLALGCTGARARRCGWGLASMAAMLGALYVSRPSTVLALMLVAALVPGSLLLGASRSELAELERRWLGWRLLPGR